MYNKIELSYLTWQIISNMWSRAADIHSSGAWLHVTWPSCHGKVLPA